MPNDAADESDEETSEDDHTEATDEEPMNPRLAREMKKLGGWFNPTASRRTTRATSGVGTPIPETMAVDQSGRENRSEEKAELTSVMIDAHHPWNVP